MTVSWMNKKMKTADFCDCGAEFFRRNLKRFIPAFAIYAVMFAFYTYFVTGNFNYSELYDMADSAEGDVILYAVDKVIMAYLGVFIAGVAKIFGLFVTGMLVYFTYTKVMTGKDPSRKTCIGKGIIYTLYSELWSIVSSTVLSIGLFLPLYILSIIGTVTWFTTDLSGNGGTGPSAVVFVIIIIVVLIAVAVLLIWLGTRFSLAVPFCIIKNKNVFSAAKQSWIFTRKKFFKTLGLFIAAAIFMNGAAEVVISATTVGMLESNLAVRILTAVLNGAAAVIDFVSPVITVFYVVYYESKNGNLDDERELNAFLKERGV